MGGLFRGTVGIDIVAHRRSYIGNVYQQEGGRLLFCGMSDSFKFIYT